MNFVCTVFEQGDEKLTSLSMEKKNNGRMQPRGDSYVKIKRWRSKGMQEKESIMVVRCG